MNRSDLKLLQACTGKREISELWVKVWGNCLLSTQSCVWWFPCTLLEACYKFTQSVSSKSCWNRLDKDWEAGFLFASLASENTFSCYFFSVKQRFWSDYSLGFYVSFSMELTFSCSWLSALHPLEHNDEALTSNRHSKCPQWYNLFKHQNTQLLQWDDDWVDWGLWNIGRLNK